MITEKSGKPIWHSAQTGDSKTFTLFTNQRNKRDTEELIQKIGKAWR